MLRHIRRALVATLVMLSLTTPGLGSAAAPAKENGSKPTPEQGDYRMGPEDVLDVAVWNNTSISRTVPVRPDGKISLPLLNDVQAAGLTPMQLRDVLTKKLVEYVPAPEVSIIVREVRSFNVSVIGEIRAPGRYELKSRTTVLDVLARAGPFSDFASRARIFVLRPNGTTMKRIPFNYNKVIAADGEAENFLVQPGDIVVVP